MINDLVLFKKAFNSKECKTCYLQLLRKKYWSTTWGAYNLADFSFKFCMNALNTLCYSSMSKLSFTLQWFTSRWHQYSFQISLKKKIDDQYFWVIWCHTIDGIATVLELKCKGLQQINKLFEGSWLHIPKC